jgi:hypothetical protein
MKTGQMAKRGLYVGAGVGLTLFALIGLLPGSFIGGIIGLNIAGSIFGIPLHADVLPRIIVGVSMILGVMFSAVLFVVGSSTVGWLIGTVVDALRHSPAAAESPVKVK